MALPLDIDRAHALQPVAALRDACLCVTRVAVAGLTFRAVHPWLPARLSLAGIPFALASLDFLLAHLARRWLEGAGLPSALAEAGLLFATLLLVSVANRRAEMFVVLCICAGIDGIAAAASLLGLGWPGHPMLSTLLLAWLASAIPLALLRLGLARL